jgi:hypothetical protein
MRIASLTLRDLARMFSRKSLSRVPELLLLEYFPVVYYVVVGVMVAGTAYLLFALVLSGFPEVEISTSEVPRLNIESLEEIEDWLKQRDIDGKEGIDVGNRGALTRE